MVSITSGAMAPPPIPTPTKTPFRRPTLALKRDSSYMDTDDESGLSSSTKKLRVAFDPNVDVRIVEDWSEKSFDLVKEEVTQGIDRHIAPGDQKEDAQYLKLLQLLGQDAFSSEPLTSKLLKKYVLAIDSKVSVLGECGKLVTAVLDLSWLGRDDTFVTLFTKFLCDLASAHATYIPAMMERLIPHFTKLPASLGRLPEESSVSRAKMFARLHMVIKAVLRQIPSASSALIRVLRLEFPNDLATNQSYLQYQKHLLRLAEQAPELKSEVLALLVQRLVNIDVQIQLDLEDLAEDAEDKLLQQTDSKGADDAAEDSDDSDVDSLSESEETMTEEEERMRDIKLKVGKMDGTLNLLFGYYSPRIAKDSAPASNEAYQQLLTHFAAFILPNRTRHAQFLLFHFSQLSPAHTEMFVERCLETAVGEKASSTHRLTACAYLSSFVARGANIPKESVRQVLDILCYYLENTRQRYASICRGPDKRNYSLYYSLAQAVIYIFCFRWRDLVIGTSIPGEDNEHFDVDEALAEGQELAFLPDVKRVMHDNIYCRLNPLKVCSPAIVSEFAELANHLRFLFVFPLLETNKRLRLGQTYSYYGNGPAGDIGRRETAWDRKAGEAHHQLEAYFPFDPYYLPKSKHWVATEYNEWKLPPGMRKDDEREESESEDEGESDDESLPDEVEYLPAATSLTAS